MNRPKQVLTISLIFAVLLPVLSASAKPKPKPGSALPELMLSEVFTDPIAFDGDLEWVEIVNTTKHTIQLSGFALGSGGSDFLFSAVQLEGRLKSGEVLVIGGPGSNSKNGNPFFDQIFDFDPNLPNGYASSPVRGVALFDASLADLQSDFDADGSLDTLPIDTLFYGSTEAPTLLDEKGDPGMADFPQGSPENASMVRLGLDSWGVRPVGLVDPGQITFLLTEEIDENNGKPKNSGGNQLALVGLQVSVLEMGLLPASGE